MNDPIQNQQEQEFLDPENKSTLFFFLKKRNPAISEEAFDVINRMAPLRVVEKILGAENSLSDNARNFFRKIETTNNGAKPGENFEDFLWRYIESDDVVGITEDEFAGLAEVYEKISQSENVPAENSSRQVRENLLKENEQDAEDLLVEKKEVLASNEAGQGVKINVKGEEDIPEEEILPSDKNLKIDNNETKNKMDIKKSIQDAQIDLVKELAIDKLPEQEQEKQLAQIAEVLQQRILIRIVEEFPEDKKDELLRLVEGKDTTPENFQSFTTEHLPNVDELVLDEIGRYKKEMVEMVEGVLGEDA